MLVWSLVANCDRALTGRSRLYSPCRDAMRNLLSLRSAVEYLINSATKPKEAHTMESCDYMASLVYRAAANSVIAKRTLKIFEV